MAQGRRRGPRGLVAVVNRWRVAFQSRAGFWVESGPKEGVGTCRLASAFGLLTALGRRVAEVSTR